uniref:Uncharacterized protein n=1 Tax=Magnetococcus massalia (strain MO-1) TaxID=451514 RepID=A0A1S7LJ84_MAGMO|nr:conserved membrane protein of unknown function [Candidatus Magnetococcus massalia]
MKTAQQKKQTRLKGHWRVTLPALIAAPLLSGCFVPVYDSESFYNHHGMMGDPYAAGYPADAYANEPYGYATYGQGGYEQANYQQMVDPYAQDPYGAQQQAVYVQPVYEQAYAQPGVQQAYAQPGVQQAYAQPAQQSYGQTQYGYAQVSVQGQQAYAQVPEGYAQGYAQQQAYAQPVYGQQAAYGQQQYAQPIYDQQTAYGQQQYAQPVYGQAVDAYGQPVYGYYNQPVAAYQAPAPANTNSSWGTVKNQQGVVTQYPTYTNGQMKMPYTTQGNQPMDPASMVPEWQMSIPVQIQPTQQGGAPAVQQMVPPAPPTMPDRQAAIQDLKAVPAQVAPGGMVPQTHYQNGQQPVSQAIPVTNGG